MKKFNLRWLAISVTICLLGIFISGLNKYFSALVSLAGFIAIIIWFTLSYFEDLVTYMREDHIFGKKAGLFIGMFFGFGIISASIISVIATADTIIRSDLGLSPIWEDSYWMYTLMYIIFPITFIIHFGYRVWKFFRQ